MSKRLTLSASLSVLMMSLFAFVIAPAVHQVAPEDGGLQVSGLTPAFTAAADH